MWCIDVPLSVLDEHPLFLSQMDRLNISLAGGEGVAPEGFDVTLFNPKQSPVQCRFKINWFNVGKQISGRIILHNKLIAKTFDERGDDAGRNGCYPMHPV